MDLPLKASEAAALADAVFSQAAQRPVTDELRSWLHARIRGLGLTRARPYMGSLQADPLQSCSYFLAVDGESPLGTVPLLLRMALATAPASALFRDCVPVARVRPGGGREVVVTAIPFAPTDEEAIRAYAEEADPACLPRPMGSQSAITVLHEDAAASAERAFQVFQQIDRNLRMNLAAHAGREAALIWAAIRTGWRRGYALESVSRLIVDPASIPACTSPVDIEVSLRAQAQGTTAESLRTILADLQSRNQPVQFVAPKPGAAPIQELAEVAQLYRVALSFYESEVAREEIRGMARVNYKIAAAGSGWADRIVSLAANLRA